MRRERLELAYSLWLCPMLTYKILFSWAHPSQLRHTCKKQKQDVALGQVQLYLLDKWPNLLSRWEWKVLWVIYRQFTH